MHKLNAGLLFMLATVSLPLLGQQQAANRGATRATAYVEELRKENRLPEWANYVCYQDAKNLETGLFILIGYQPVKKDPFFQEGKSARDFGYHRGLTFQEYINSDVGITTMNMPMSPEAYATELPKAIQSGQISLAANAMLRAQIVTIQNAIAIAKNTRQYLSKFPTLESTYLKDEETQALLDGPEGTNYNNFVDKHPEYLQSLIYRQKYYGAGTIDPKDGFKVYREGNVIFESDFGSDVFESAGSGGKIGDHGKSASSGLEVRIQMEDTASGLRFVQSHSLNGSGIGIPITGACDAISMP